ncbi:FAD/NAD(P)-binding domain-containing protein [Schizophyllum commune Tattone D]|nr:FAD/NAD(P)-binding domain-containing protein [Schizophyllum commune Tattone D]
MSVPLPDSVSPIKCLVIGASFEGLIVAYLLQQAGHQVVVVDKGDADRQVFERGIRSPPNVARLFSQLPKVTSVRQRTGSGLEFIDGRTARTVGTSEFFDNIMRDLGSNFYMGSHSHIMQFLRGLCRDVQMDIRYNQEVVSLSSAESGNPVLHLKSGDTIEGDLVIGADGLNGISRSFIPPLPRREDTPDSDESDQDPLSKMYEIGVRTVLGVTFSILPEDMEKNPRLAPLLKKDTIKVWMESDSMGMSSLVHDPDVYIFVLGKVMTEEYVDTGLDIREELKDIVELYDPTVKELLDLAHSYRKEIQRLPETLTIVDKERKIALIGNSAFVSPYYGVYNDTIAFEAAFTLARLLSRLSKPAYLPILLDGFQKIRTFRNVQTLASELQAIRLMGLPPGPSRTERDAALALPLTQEDDESAEVWAKTLVQFDYDALDAADEWWLQWGKFLVDRMDTDHGAA